VIWPYYPYRFSLINEDWKASELIGRKRGHCIDKVVILIAILRAANIPARLGLAKVKNHIAVDHMVEKIWFRCIGAAWIHRNLSAQQMD
jgi:transglutaminase-like putative cysteine protease